MYYATMIGMSFQKLAVWQKGMNISVLVYRCTDKYPKSELYGLVSQMRRCAISVPSNIAEGSQRTSQKEFANFILIAKGSLAELLTQLLLSKELEYISEEDFVSVQTMITDTDKMLFSFHQKLIS